MTKKKTLRLGRLLEIQRDFVKEREWEQFHTPKNIAMALGVEASELAEIFLWMDGKESKKVMQKTQSAAKVRAEVADVFYWLLRLSDVLGVDLEAAFIEKMLENKRKYPTSKAKGKSTKYSEL